MTTKKENEKKYSAEESIQEFESYLELAFEIPKITSFVKPENLRKHLKIIKESVESELEYSRGITLREQEIIENANRRAEEIVRNKQLELKNQDIVRQAENYAKQIVTEAQKKAQSLLDEGQKVQQQLIISGHKYVDQLLVESENNLRVYSDKIANNRNELRASLHEKQNKNINNFN